jgi:hypothetical protein
MFAISTDCVLLRVRAETKQTREHQTNNTDCVHARTEYIAAVCVFR